MSAKHEFALYLDQLPPVANDQIIILDADLVHRVLKVLRFTVGQTLVLFDGIQSVRLTITHINKKQLVGTVLTQEVVAPLTPKINCFVPVLKRAALEEVVYATAELGANTIQLVLTQKVHRKWGGDKELNRLRGIMLAACEQAKQFAVPALYAPVTFTEAAKKLTDTALFFDPDGQPAYDVITSLRQQQPTQLSLLLGPEGDLSLEEKDALRAQAITFCALTPTVLRARQAFSLGLGLVRSML